MSKPGSQCAMNKSSHPNMLNWEKKNSKGSGFFFLFVSLVLVCLVFFSLLFLNKVQKEIKDLRVLIMSDQQDELYGDLFSHICQK